MVWENYKASVPTADIQKVFALSEQQVKLFSYLKLMSIETRLDAVFPEAPQSKVVQSTEPDVDATINLLNNKLASASLACQTA